MWLAYNLVRLAAVNQAQSTKTTTIWPKILGLCAKEKNTLIATNKDGVSSASTILFLSERMMVEPLYMLKNMVLEPECEPFYSTYGASFYEHMAKEPKFGKLFQEFMTYSAKLLLDEVLKVYRGFEEVKELLYVGGGMGTSLGNIISMYPHIHGKIFDLPNVISVAPKLSGLTF